MGTSVPARAPASTTRRRLRDSGAFRHVRSAVPLARSVRHSSQPALSSARRPRVSFPLALELSSRRVGHVAPRAFARGDLGSERIFNGCSPRVCDVLRRRPRARARTAWGRLSWAGSDKEIPNPPQRLTFADPEPRLSASLETATQARRSFLALVRSGYAKLPACRNRRRDEPPLPPWATTSSLA